MYFSNEQIYINSATNAQDRITKIDEIITALLNNVLANAGQSNTQEYMLNDGQTIIKKAYRNPTEVMNTVGVLEKMKQYYVNQINDRQVRLVDGKNFFTPRQY